jgi:hypothetical protein
MEGDKQSSGEIFCSVSVCALQGSDLNINTHTEHEYTCTQMHYSLSLTECLRTAVRVQANHNPENGIVV